MRLCDVLQVEQTSETGGTNEEEDSFVLSGDNWMLIFVPPFPVKLTVVVTSSFFPFLTAVASLYGEL